MQQMMNANRLANGLALFRKMNECNKNLLAIMVIAMYIDGGNGKTFPVKLLKSFRNGRRKNHGKIHSLTAIEK